jgi:two-component system probable response regulator PhcQ
MKAPRTILVVDDEPPIRVALKRSLEHEGYTVHTVEGGAEALAWLAKNEVQLIISDNMMPKMSGLEFLSFARERHPHACRVMLTANTDGDVAARAINECGVYRFLEKPWRDVELKVLLHVAFEQLDLEAENRRLLSVVRRQAEAMLRLEKEHPGILDVVRDEDGAILLTQPKP